MKNLSINPILKKEMRVEARTIRLSLSIMLYALIMAGIAAAIIASANNSYYYSGYGVNYKSYTNSFWLLAVVQCFMVCIIMPTITAGSISGEREKQTLDIMLTTPISPLSIAFGKLNAAMVKLMMYILAGLPAMGVCFIYGGIQWGNLLVFLLDVIVIAYFVGAIGIYCSARYRKTVPAIIVTMVLENAFYILPVVILVLVYAEEYQKYLTTNNYVISLGYLPLLLLLNPLFGAADFLLKTTGQLRLASELASAGWTTAKGMQTLADLWTPLFLVAAALITLLFLFLASRRIDYSRRKNQKMKK